MGTAKAQTSPSLEEVAAGVREQRAACTRQAGDLEGPRVGPSWGSPDTSEFLRRKGETCSCL